MDNADSAKRLPHINTKRLCLLTYTSDVVGGVRPKTVGVVMLNNLKRAELLLSLIHGELLTGYGINRCVFECKGQK